MRCLFIRNKALCVHGWARLPDLPLVVDLDGSFVSQEIPLQALKVCAAQCMRGKESCASLIRLLVYNSVKQKEVLLAMYVRYHDPGTLPTHPLVVDCVKHWIQCKRSVYLATGTPLSYVQHLLTEHADFRYFPRSHVFGSFSAPCPAFDFCFRYPELQGVNLVGDKKANVLLAHFPQGFIYLGNSQQDLAVWNKAHTGIFVGSFLKYCVFSWKQRLQGKRFPIHVCVCKKAGSL